MAVKRRKAADVVQTIDAWSYSRLSTYESCPRRAKFLYIQKLPQADSPAMERGSRIHEQAEKYLKGTAELPNTAVWQPWKEDMLSLRIAGYEAEKNIAFDSNWNVCEYFGPSTWVRMRMDATGITHCPEAIDYKTGRPYHTHAEQAELYGIAAYLTAPDPEDVEEVLVSFWYLDIPNIIERTYHADEIPGLQDKWTARANVMLTDTEFKPNGCKASCGKFSGCEFAANNGGQCIYTTAGVLKAGAKTSAAAGETSKSKKAVRSKWNGLKNK